MCKLNFFDAQLRLRAARVRFVDRAVRRERPGGGVASPADVRARSRSLQPVRGRVGRGRGDWVVVGRGSDGDDGQLGGGCGDPAHLVQVFRRSLLLRLQVPHHAPRDSRPPHGRLRAHAERHQFGHQRALLPVRREVADDGRM